MKYFLKCIYNYANNKGRARRKEFWYFVLYSFILIVLWNFSWSVIDYYFDKVSADPQTLDNYIFGYFFIYLFLIPPFMTVMSRRIHDIGCSFLTVITPILCLYFAIIVWEEYLKDSLSIDIEYEGIVTILFGVIFLYFLLKKGNEGNNRFGSDPRIYDPIEMTNGVTRFRKAAEQGDITSQNNLGVCYYYGYGVSKNLEEAIKWFRKAAKQGCVEAQSVLGSCYYNGYGIPQDLEKAVKWFSKAAEQGNAHAEYMLAICYYNGYGVSQNLKDAVIWFRKAAEQWDSQAQYMLGVCYQNGEGIARNKEEAVTWFRKAAEQGDVQAQYKLGICYKNGEGVSKDLRDAAYWLRKAAYQGNEEALDDLDSPDFDCDFDDWDDFDCDD